MKKIIVPVDFSEISENALKSAAFLAKKSNSELIIVHMLELSSSLINQSESYSQEQAIFYLKLAEKKFNEFLDKDYLEDINVKPIIRHYKILSELNNIAKEEEADLIVMGSHGVTSLKDQFIGSNTEKVVRNSNIPVLVIKGVPVTTDFMSAVFACNFLEEDVKPYLKAKNFLTENLGCKLQLLNVNTPYGKFKSTRERHEKVSKFLVKAEENAELLKDVAFIADYSVEKGILEYANLNGSDLIIMATHGRKGLNHFFEGSISEDVANHSTLPVLTFKI